jgi:hypothetical protein
MPADFFKHTSAKCRVDPTTTHPSGFLAPNKFLSVCLAGALGLFCCDGLEAQGFGTLTKKKITLHRKLPAVVHFTGTTFTIKASARDAKLADTAGSVKDLLQTELLKNNNKLRDDANNPELSIFCTVMSFDVPSPQSFTRNEVVMQKGKQLTQPVTYNKITGSLEVSYQAKETRTGRVLDADNVVAHYSEDFEAGTNQKADKSIATKMTDPFKRLAGKKTEDSSGPPTTPELKQKLIHEAVHELTSRITTTNEPVDILLAVGKMDKANKLAETGLWTRDLEELEQMQPLQDPKDDAYRLYDIGVADEALAYQAEDHATAKKFLQEAAINYGKAVDAKPDEKYFLEPQKRIETAMAYYRKIEGQQKSVEAANAVPTKTETPPSGSSPASSSSATKGASSASNKSSSNQKSGSSSQSTSSGQPGSGAATTNAVPALTNDQVIKMAKAGVDEDSIIATIHDAAAVKFDLTPDGQIQLTSGGVKPKVLAAMRQRAKLPNRRAGTSGSN